MSKHSRGEKKQKGKGAVRFSPLSPFVLFTSAVLVVCVGYVALRPRDPQSPAIPTSGLDPAVAKLIEATLAEVRASPRSGEAWGKLGSVLMHYEFVQQTRRAFEVAEALSPHEPRWPHLHGLAVSTRDIALATEKFRRAASLARERRMPGSVNGNVRSGENRSIPLTDPNPDAPRLRLAQALAERGHDEEATAHFQTLVRQTPNHPPAQLGLARIRHAQGRLADATNHLAACLRDPHTARSAHALLAAIQQAQANAEPPNAERGAGSAEIRAPKSALPVSSRAAAAARASAALPADVPWPDPWWTQALAFRVGRKAMIEDATALIDQGRLPQALTTLDRATRENPHDEEAWYLLGWALNQRPKVQSPRSEVQSGPKADDFGPWTQNVELHAERALREHLRLWPQSPKGHAQLAVALLGQQRHAEATDVLQAALKLKPTWRELHSNLGFASVSTLR